VDPVYILSHSNTIDGPSLNNSNAIPVTGRGGLQGCKMLRITHCLDSRLTDGGEVVSFMHRPPSTPQKHYFFASGTHFS
jgi:hypothetical protein